MKKVIATDKAPSAIGPYSQGIAASGKMVFVSGQIPIDPATGAFAADAGCSYEDVVKTTVLLAHIADFGPMNEVYAKYFNGDCPARAAFAVKDLPKGALVEIEVIAVKE